MESDQVQCPYCLKHVRLRGDGKLPKHTVTSRNHRGGRPCVASEVALDEARELKAAGKKPGQAEPEDVF